MVVTDNCSALLHPDRLCGNFILFVLFLSSGENMVTGKGGTTEYNGIKITLFGHASVMLESKAGKVIYIDPYVLPSGRELEKLPKADLVIFTHGHYDHCVDPEPIEKEHTEIIGCGCKYAQRDVRPGDKVALGWVTVEIVHGYNPNKKFHPKNSATGVIVDIDGVRIYHAGDTDYIPEMKGYRCDVALLPIGGTYTMDVDEAVKAVRDIKPKLVIPIHYNVIEGTEADPNEFAAKVKKEAPGIEVKVLY